LQHLLLESRPELTVPDLMFVAVRIPGFIAKFAWVELEAQLA